MADKKEYTVINLSAADDSPAFPQMKLNRKGWLAFGAKNLFPQELINFNSKSPVNSSIIASKVTYICGKGVRDTNVDAGKYMGRPSVGESWDDFIEPVATDYCTFGGFYWQVVLNKDSETVSIFHQDYSTVRIGTIDDEGTPQSFQLNNDWSKVNAKNKPIDIPVWCGMAEAKPETPYLFYYWDYAPGLHRYSVPDYFPAIEYVKADGTLGQFYNNSIENGFTPSVVISMPSNPDEPTKAAFQKQMEDAFSGAKGASSIVVLWGENDVVKPEITPYNATANADVYNNVEGIIFQKIISAHRLSSPTLAGVSGSGNLSGNAAEIIDAFILFNYTVIEKKRRKILDKINIFTTINGLPAVKIAELDVLPRIASTQNPDDISAPINTETGESSGSLAAEIGVGGTQALTAIIENPNLPEEQKRGLLKTLFGLDDAVIDSLFAKQVATLKRSSKKSKFINQLKSILEWK